MTIENDYTPVKVSGDGAELVFSFTFKIYADTDIIVQTEIKLCALPIRYRRRQRCLVFARAARRDRRALTGTRQILPAFAGDLRLWLVRYGTRD
jgi:hypothetical protein